MTEQRRGGVAWTLLALRFGLELALLVAIVVVAVSSVGGAVGWLLGIAVAVVAAAAWGVVLSPRRRVDAPLVVRVVVEILLFVAAGIGLALTGLAALGIALVVAEILVVGWLWALGMPPGTNLEDAA